MSELKNQYPRGSCSAFASIALLEFGSERRYSEQCLVACDLGHLQRDAGWSYPYINSGNLLARLDKQQLKVQFGYPDPVEVIKKLLNNGQPVAGNVYVVNLPWWRSRTDNPPPVEIPPDEQVLEECRRPGKKGRWCVLHALAFTGYSDFEQSLEFKNSWGRWHGDGYGKMTYDYFRRFHASGAGAELVIYDRHADSP